MGKADRSPPLLGGRARHKKRRLSQSAAPAKIMISESEPSPANPSPPADQRGTDAADLILAALDHLRRGLSADGGACGPPTLARQKEDLHQWADRLGLLLSTSDLPSKVVRGGQEHELFHDEATDRYFEVILHTRSFTLMPLVKNFTISLELIDDPGQSSRNRTRQGYARKRILKPAGRFFYPLSMGRRAA